MVSLGLSIVQYTELTQWWGWGPHAVLVQDENIRLSPIRVMSLEDVVTYIGEDEMIDVSPTRIRMRCVRSLSSQCPV